MTDDTLTTSRLTRLGEVFSSFLILGLTSFGGPIAHLGFFRKAFVEKRQWLSEAAYAEIVALCQFLPGPASSQVGMVLGLLRAGLMGAFVAWVAFTLPSALLMLGFALGLGALEQTIGSGALHGLKIAALAVVVQALWGMARGLTPDAQRLLIALGTAALLLVVPHALMQVVVLVIGAVLGLSLKGVEGKAPSAPMPQLVSWSLATSCLVILAVLLVGLPMLAGTEPLFAIVDKMVRAGALVFGGGHVVLPLLEAEFVATGLVARDAFLAGYGAAQALPGPLFAFAAHVGANAMPAAPILGGVVALCAIYMPSFLLVLGGLPFWGLLRTAPQAQKALAGANAAVVGMLLAAAYDPVFTSAVARPADFAFALVVFAALQVVRLPPWLVVLGAALAGWVLARAGVF